MRRLYPNKEYSLPVVAPARATCSDESWAPINRFNAGTAPLEAAKPARNSLLFVVWSFIALAATRAPSYLCNGGLDNVCIGGMCVKDHGLSFLIEHENTVRKRRQFHQVTGDQQNCFTVRRKF